MKTKKDLILVIALLALVSLLITPAMAETFTDNIYYDSMSVTQSPSYSAGVAIPANNVWLSADNQNLPNLRYIFWRSTNFYNDTEMPLDSTYLDTIRFYKLSDGAKINPIAEGILNVRFDGGTPMYKAVGLTLTTPFQIADLTGETETFNVSFSGNSSFYHLYSTSMRSACSATVCPFGPSASGTQGWTYQGTAGYTYHGYQTFIDWDLNVSDSYGYYPITETLTANAGTSGINFYTYFPNGTLFDYKSNLLNTTIFSHNINPFTIKINQTATPSFNFEKTYTFFGLPPSLPGTHNITFHVKDSAATNIYHAHISFDPVSNGEVDLPGDVLTGYTDAAGLLTFYNATAGASAIVDVTATGFPEYIETFSFTSDMTKEITLSSPSISLYLDVKDSTYGYYLDGATSGIKNTTSGTWRNSTGNGARYFDSTGASYEFPLAIGQTVVVAATMPGYQPASETVTIPYDKYLVTLHMININGSAPSSGNFTAVIAAGSVTTGLEIPGASIVIQDLGRMASTNQAGVATFRNLPVGTYTISASATGYQPAVSSISGTDQETVMKRIRLLPTGCSQSETGTVSCNGTVVIPGGGTGVSTTNQTPNEKAAGGVTAFLDNIIGIGMLVLILILFWFVKKIFFS